MNPAENFFWNNDNIIDYFAEKPADPAIESRLDIFDRCIDTSSIKALDLGCGGGRHSELLASRGYNLVAVDRNDSMISYTQRRLGRLGLDASYFQLSIENLALKAESMDVVIATGVLHQAKSIENYEMAISEVSRVMKKGGLLSMNIFTNYAWDESYRVPNDDEPWTVKTMEGLEMTLLSSAMFYNIADSYGLKKEDEISHDIKNENTGKRSVLKAHLIKN
jgi:ubiquinone/menaquinone biosynthesis C-methylase UbiE